MNRSNMRSSTGNEDWSWTVAPMICLAAERTYISISHVYVLVLYNVDVGDDIRCNKSDIIMVEIGPQRTVSLCNLGRAARRLLCSESGIAAVITDL